MSYDVMFMKKDEASISEAEMNDIAAELQKLLPDLAPFKRDYDAIARHENISIDEARAKYKHIELNPEPEPGDGLQVTIDTNSIFVTVPYWHTGDKAKEVFARIARCGKLLSNKGFQAADVQLDGQEISFERDIPQMIEVYSSMSGRLQAIGDKFPVKKPWWKFW